MLDIIGVPFDHCGGKRGSSLGPDALRLAGLHQALDSLHVKFRDRGNLRVPRVLPAQKGIVNFRLGLQNCRAVRKQVLQSMAQGRVPMVLGGDHSISIGSVSAALQATKLDLAIVWIDAHGDFNTPRTTPSRNLHGMALAALAGLSSGTDGVLDQQWMRIQTEVVHSSKLPTNHIAWIGLRNVDFGERDAIRAQKGAFLRTMQDIDVHGIGRVASDMGNWFAGTKCSKLWISFDVDSLDPALAPGTGTSVRGGLSYREAHLLSELLHDMVGGQGTPKLAGIDIVEVNPLLDMYNQTAQVTVEWVASLLGKSIMGQR